MLGRIDKFANSLLFKLSVPKCVCCRKRLLNNEKALCEICLNKYREAKTRSCSICSKILSECSCQNLYLKTHFVKGLSKLVRYNSGVQRDVALRLIINMKNKRREDVLDFVAHEMVKSINTVFTSLPHDTVVTYVPNRKSAIRERGFDHAGVLAEAVAKRLNFEFMPLLKSTATKAQKSLTQLQRQANARFELLGDPDIKGRTVLIIDDVVTSGASMGNSASMIRALRPQNIYGAAVAIAYKDERIYS